LTSCSFWHNFKASDVAFAGTFVFVAILCAFLFPDDVGSLVNHYLWQELLLCSFWHNFQASDVAFAGTFDIVFFLAQLQGF
jgi:hypothetical protein